MSNDAPLSEDLDLQPYLSLHTRILEQDWVDIDVMGGDNTPGNVIESSSLIPEASSSGVVPHDGDSSIISTASPKPLLDLDPTVFAEGRFLPFSIDDHKEQASISDELKLRRLQREVAEAQDSLRQAEDEGWNNRIQLVEIGRLPTSPPEAGRPNLGSTETLSGNSGLRIPSAKIQPLPAISAREPVPTPSAPLQQVSPPTNEQQSSQYTTVPSRIHQQRSVSFQDPKQTRQTYTVSPPAPDAPMPVQSAQTKSSLALYEEKKAKLALQDESSRVKDWVTRIPKGGWA